MPFCQVCSVEVTKKQWIGHLRSNIHKSISMNEISSGIVKISSAFQGRIASYRILALEFEQSLPEIFLENISSKLKSILNSSLSNHDSIKVNFEYFGTFLLFKNNEQETKSFVTKNIVICKNYSFDCIFQTLIETIKKKIQEFEERDSGWTFLCNSYLEVNVNKYDPLNGSSYIDLPRLFRNKKACLNIKNSDPYCFLWSIVAAVYPTSKNSARTSSYPHFRDVLNIQNMNLPVTFADIKVFESNNSNISVNVYSLKNSNTIVGPIYRSEFKRKIKVNLLLIDKGNKSHYVLIKNLPRLVGRQVTKHHAKLYFCDDCLLFFSTEINLNNHICSGVATVLPEKGSFVQFKNFQRKQDVPFVIYADFETLLKPVHGCEPDPCCSYTAKQQLHVPAAFAYHIVCSFDENLNKFRQYRGPDCVIKFIEFLLKDVKEIYCILNTEIPIIFSEENAKAHASASKCHICNELLFFDKVRDHCHLTGCYRGAAHQYCNLRYSVPKLLPIFFHNLSGYDCHLFIKELGELEGNIKVIPKSKESYISFTKFLKISDSQFAQVRFVDSYKFLSASIAKLVNGLDTDDFIYLKKYFPEESQFQLVKRKGVYPYDFMTDWKKFLYDQLPPKQCFYNMLNDENVSDACYNHAKTVWETFGILNMGEYTDLYLKTDVLLLTDIFENFRKVCKFNYQLDPAFYLTAPSLSFDAMLLKTGIRLELLNDLEIVRLIQKGIRGGICMCSTRHAKANNKYMNAYDPSKPSSYIVYIDCNNLYGYSMSQTLPVSDFRFLNQIEIKHLDVLQVSDDAEFGFILEVDISYPEHLHCFHNDYPFCAQKFIPQGGKTSKLIPNLYSKFHYVIHYVHLKTCLKNGLLLNKIHRVVTFKQKPFLKKYIDLNTELRKKATSPFQQELFKLFNNSVFGKTLENTENRVDVKLVNCWTDSKNKTNKTLGANKLISRPNFHSTSIFSKDLVAIQMKPERIILDKPIYIGFSVLELSKSHMYQFHYSVMKPFYKHRIQLCYTDTDSFVYTIETDDFYNDLRNNFINFFDTSNYIERNTFQLPIVNKKIPGLFKDELGGEIVTEFVGLRSKLYCIKTEKKVIKKAKGIKRNVIRDLSSNDYQNVLLNNSLIRKQNILFKSIKHEIFTQSVNKIALSSQDDKRYIKSDKISTVAWGHKTISF